MVKVPVVVTYLAHILKMFAIYVEPKFKKLEIFHFYFYSIILYGFNMILYSFALYSSRKSYTQFLNVLAHTVGTTCLYLMLCSVQINRQYFIKCYQNILQNRKYVNEEFYRITGESIHKIKFRIATLLGICMLDFNINPFLAILLTKDKLGSSSTLIAPQKFPWNQGSPTGYAVTFLYQAFRTNISLSVFIGMAIFQILYWIVLESHYKILSRKIDQLSEIIVDKDGRKVANQEEIKMNVLNEIIHYHRYLKMIADNFIRATEGSVNVSIFSCFSVSVLLLGSLAMSERNVILYMKIINLESISVAYFFVQCYVGERLNDLNDEIQFQVYNTNWFEHPIKFRKQMNLFLLFLQSPFRIQFFGTYFVNLSLLMALVQKVYATIQVILTMRI